MSPSYMKEAWQKELEMIAEDGLTPDEMLVLGLEEGSDQMPFFFGCNVYPIFPGPASKWVNKTRQEKKRKEKKRKEKKRKEKKRKEKERKGKERKEKKRKDYTFLASIE